MKRTNLVVLTAVIAVVLAATATFLSSRGHRSKASAIPIVLVHGYSPIAGCPGGDIAKYWSGLIPSFAAAGWKNPVVPVSYYECDTNGVDIDSRGDPKAYFPSGEVTRTDGAVAYSRATDIRHLAYVLAWYVYDTYSSHGRPVDLVGHSMGGLMIRWALQQVAARNAAFPAYLLVENAVTISTPYQGVVAALGGRACGGALQCEQFSAGSPFLEQLDEDPNPQARHGTDWTVMGGGPCDIVSAASATDMVAHKITWTRPCYDHSGILFDESQHQDTTVTFSRPTDNTLISADSQLHSVAAVLRALESSKW